MLFLTYWELNENMPEGDRHKFVQKIMSSGLFPPKGVEVIRWDITPDGWGIVICEQQSATDVVKSLDMWRMAEGGFFKSTKTAPIISIQESMAMSEGLVKALA
ncbi:MAG: DUF3303 domain-containing protein [Betaproteobacteria bacterium]|nr:DUF3303 domain-containing protein [Betaproteobacteria bacterium]